MLLFGTTIMPDPANIPGNNNDELKDLIDLYNPAVGGGESMDPWAALSKHANLGTKIEYTVAIYKILMRIGIYGALITTVIYFAGLALLLGDPSKMSEYKSKIRGKFIVVFLICASSFLISIILKIAQSIGA